MNRDSLKQLQKQEDGPQLLTRRLALIAGVVTLAGVSFSNQDLILDQFIARTPAEDRFLNFPDSFPGVREIIKHRHRGAKHCLVHIQQLHVRLDATEKGFEGAKLSQSSINNVLSAFKSDQRINLKEIYAEGEVGAGYSSERDVVDALFRLVTSPAGASRDQLLEILKTLPIELQQQFITLVRDEAKLKHIIQLPGVFSATSELARKGIKLNAGEDAHVREKAGANFDPVESRNKALLEIVAGTKDTLSVAIFGVAHAFRPTIASWNQNNPLHKFCLIEVLPEGTAIALERGLF